MKNYSGEGIKNIAGFTLLEVFIVASLLVLLSSTGINHLNSYREHMLLRLSAQAFSGELNRARAASIACGVPVEIRLSRDRRTYNLRLKYAGTDFARFTLPGSLEFTSEPSRPIVFYNSGTCAPSGSYVIASDKLSVKVVVSIMGRVRWEFL
ncbi:MAG: hypothetical protein ABIJ42_06975 [Acidobacteriota bacterium]